MVLQFVTEASATLKRRGVGKPEDVWLKSPLYPQYYLNTFHYQVLPLRFPAPAQHVNPPPIAVPPPPHHCPLQCAVPALMAVLDLAYV